MHLSTIYDPFDSWQDDCLEYKSNQSYEIKFSRIGSFLVYNPSIVHMSPSKFLFAGRLTWQESPECAELQGAKELYYCMRAFPTKHSTIFGEFNENSCTATITKETLLKDGLTSTALGYITGWFHGSGWYDTKLLLPIDTTALRSNQTSYLNSIIVATQRSERIRPGKFRELIHTIIEGQIMFQMMFIGARNRNTGTLTFSRAIYIDGTPEDWATPLSIM